MNLWEFHPMLVHFPIAFLLAVVVLDLLALRWPRESTTRAARDLLFAGTAFGWLAVAAGFLAFYTVPAHTEEAHSLMFWHLGVGLAALAIFTWQAVSRWQQGPIQPRIIQCIVGCCGAMLLMITGALGGWIVYHGGAGVDPDILAPEIREGHSHYGNEHSHQGRSETTDAATEHDEDAHRHDGQ